MIPCMRFSSSSVLVGHHAAAQRLGEGAAQAVLEVGRELLARQQLRLLAVELDGVRRLRRRRLSARTHRLARLAGRRVPPAAEQTPPAVEELGHPPLALGGRPRVEVVDRQHGVARLALLVAGRVVVVEQQVARGHVVVVGDGAGLGRRGRRGRRRGSRHQVPRIRKTPSQSSGISIARSQRSRGRGRLRRRIDPVPLVAGRISVTVDGSLSRAMARVSCRPGGFLARLLPTEETACAAAFRRGALLRLALALALLEGVVGGDDLLHQRMADDVLLGRSRRT